LVEGLREASYGLCCAEDTLAGEGMVDENAEVAHEQIKALIAKHRKEQP
jgi:hypothetical protein